MLLKGQAYLWYQSLANGGKTDAAQLVDSFKRRYEPTPLTKIQLVSEAWSRKQKHDESVDTYVAVLRRLQATIDSTKAVFTDNNMRDAIKTGLKPSIRQYVLQQAPATLDATIEAARKAEQAAMPMPGEEVTLSASLERIESKINRLSLRNTDHSDNRHRSSSTTSRSQSHHQEANGTPSMHSRCASLSPSRTSSNRNFSYNRAESPYRHDQSTSQRPNSTFTGDRRRHTVCLKPTALSAKLFSIPPEQRQPTTAPESVRNTDRRHSTTEDNKNKFDSRTTGTVIKPSPDSKIDAHVAVSLIQIEFVGHRIRHVFNVANMDTSHDVAGLSMFKIPMHRDTRSHPQTGSSQN